ncbi:unnamed protein product [Rhizophagus irregularis]|nr:unnamed protein product [Rhizophagus irregularis]
MKFRSLFKKKLRFVSTLPSALLHSSTGYNIKNYYDQQLVNVSSNLVKQMNDEDLLGEVTAIRCSQLQSLLSLPCSPMYQ